MKKKSWLGIIFDFSFAEFITTKVIKFLLGVAIVVSVIITISGIVTAFTTSVVLGILILILSPVIFLILMLISRIYLELIIVIFKIAECLASIKEKLSAAGAVKEETVIVEKE